MKKALAAALILPLIFLALICSITGRVLASAEDVSFYEETLAGDIGAADGLSISGAVSLDGYLFWDEAIDLKTGGFSAKASFRRSSSREKEDHFSDPDSHIDLYDLIDVNYGSVAAEELEYDQGLARAFDELLAKTPAGSEGRELIRVSDHIEYYPIAFDIAVRWGQEDRWTAFGYSPDYVTRDDMQDPEVYISYKLSDFFRIPVIKDQHAWIERYNSGEEAKGTTGSQAVTWGVEPDETHDIFSLNTESVEAGDSLYFWFSNRTRDGKLVDTSLIPGGYGIYRLPIGTLRGEDEGGNVWETPYAPLADDLSLFYPVKEDAFILHIWADKQAGRLLVHIVDDNKYYVDIIEISSGTKLQKLEMGPAEMTGDMRWSWDEDSFLCEFEDLEDFETVWTRSPEMHMTLIAGGSGGYELKIDVPIDDIFKSDPNMMNTSAKGRSLAFDGERLAVCGCRDDDGYNSYMNMGCAPYVFVFGPEGLRYSGVFRNSLDDAGK